MNSDIIHAMPWRLSASERANPDWIADEPPKASDVLWELGLTLAVPLSLALLVNLWLWAAGIPAP
jgi:hypothetical protein